MPGPRNRFDRLRENDPKDTPDSRLRDQHLEERWRYERDGTMSTLAYVSAYRNELLAQFMDWYSTARVEGESKEQAVAEWERVRFGDVLDKAAHGVFLYEVLNAFFPGRHGRKLEPKPQPSIKAPSSVDGMVRKLAHAMPPTRMRRSEIDARLMELERQKQEIV